MFVTKIAPFKVLLDKAQSIVTAFKNSPLQYAHLREYQIAIYNRKLALCLSIITCWGTQYRLIDSVRKNKDALKEYMFRHEAENPKFGAGIYYYMCSFR